MERSSFCICKASGPSRHKSTALAVSIPCLVTREPDTLVQEDRELQNGSACTRGDPGAQAAAGAPRGHDSDPLCPPALVWKPPGANFNSPQIAASCWVCFYFASPSPVAFGWVSKQQSVTSGICKPGLKEDGHAPSW